METVATVYVAVENTLVNIIDEHILSNLNASRYAHNICGASRFPMEESLQRV